VATTPRRLPFPTAQKSSNGRWEEGPTGRQLPSDATSPSTSSERVDSSSAAQPTDQRNAAILQAARLSMIGSIFDHYNSTLAIFPRSKIAENGSQIGALLQRHRTLSNFVMSASAPDFT
jgi:hypothetical protein